MAKRLILASVVAIVVIALLIQLVPLDRSNPTPTREVAWNSEETRALARGACFDCHSDETVWPWYSRVAPVSFILVDHVHEGRAQLNFSEWEGPNADFEEVSEQMREGAMPPWDYLIMHPNAKLHAAGQDQLLAGLQATFASDPPLEGRGNGKGRDGDE
jgi:cytochrome c551/c552